MEEFEYKKLRFNLLNKYMEILEVEQQLYPLLKEEEQNKDKIIEMVETTHYNQLQADFNKMKKEWKQLLDNADITKENYDFIRFSKAVLGQFENNKEELQTIIFNELHRLVQSKTPEAIIKKYVSADEVKQKMIALVAQL